MKKDSLRQTCEVILNHQKAQAERKGITLEQQLLEWEKERPEAMHDAMDFFEVLGFDVPESCRTDNARHKAEIRMGIERRRQETRLLRVQAMGLVMSIVLFVVILIQGIQRLQLL